MDGASTRGGTRGAELGRVLRVTGTRGRKHVVGEARRLPSIVEQGTIRKAKHALPRSFAHPQPESNGICIERPEERPPRLAEGENGGDFDENAVARFWGIAGPERPA